MNELQTGTKGRFISLRVKLLVGFTLLFTTVFAIAFYWFYSFASDMALRRIQEDVHDTLMGAVAGVDVSQFVALCQEGETRADGYSDDPRYWAHVQWLDTVYQIEPRARVYTYFRGTAENQVIFVGSNGAMWDPPKGAKFREPYTSSGPLLRGLDETTYNLKGYKDKWGRWISAYTPI